LRASSARLLRAYGYCGYGELRVSELGWPSPVMDRVTDCASLKIFTEATTDVRKGTNLDDTRRREWPEECRSVTMTRRGDAGRREFWPDVGGDDRLRLRGRCNDEDKSQRK
jgi:hypothetical protein